MSVNPTYINISGFKTLTKETRLFVDCSKNVLTVTHRILCMIHTEYIGATEMLALIECLLIKVTIEEKG